MRKFKHVNINYISIIFDFFSNPGKVKKESFAGVEILSLTNGITQIKRFWAHPDFFELEVI